MTDQIDFLSPPTAPLIRCELRHPDTGAELVSGGKPCVILCLPKTSPEAKRMARLEISERLAEALERKDEPPKFDFERTQFEINRYASALVAGFENMQTIGEDGKARALTLDDIEAFARNPLFGEMSIEHQQRRLFGANDANRDKWLGASFAQQIIDAVEAHADFLADAAPAS